jgi:hypothetical protein
MSDVIWVPQGSAYTFRAGPFISLADVKTRITNATVNQSDRRISKAGAAYAQSAQSGALAHEANGFYPCTLAAGDIDTLGALALDIDVANCFKVEHKFFVVTAESYNALGGTGNGLRANIAAINSVTASAVRLALAAGQMIPFTVSNSAFTPTATEFRAGDLNTAGTDHYKGRSIVWTGGTLAGQMTDIEEYSVQGGQGHFLVTALNAAPANGATGLIV